ncbi:MAG: hypothetical protein JWM99_2466, partial [Verrucomicrobiales bacterium]|nr:hypothetical protein [Verrucomicrobiales bacterium]
MNTITADQLTVENFSAHLKSKFSVFFDAGRRFELELELVEAASRKSHSTGTSS